MLSVAHDIELQYGKEVPVLFTGRYYTPYEFMDDFFVEYDSWQYRTIAMLAAPLDEHLTEKYYSEYGYRFDGEASVSVIDWGFRAFDGTNREFMHGYSFTLVKDKEVLREAMEYAVSMPCWPQNGSIVEWNGYVLVHMDR